MNPLDLKYLIEATLLAAQRPVTEAQLLELFDERERPSDEALHEAIALLVADYEPRGIELVQVASGWRIQVKPKSMDVVSRLWQERPSRYSRALLETLALIAYRQPITRSEIEDIRGVAVSSTIMRTLQERNWIRVVGHREVPGRPEVLGTTKDFLDYFGLKTLDELPTLAELQDVENVGVQLELPGGEMSAEAATNDSQTTLDLSTDDTSSETSPDIDSPDIEVVASSLEQMSGDDTSESEIGESDTGESDSSDDELSAETGADDDIDGEDGQLQTASTMVAEGEQALETLQASPEK
jgi:segregation and condensation protein B